MTFGVVILIFCSLGFNTQENKSLPMKNPESILRTSDDLTSRRVSNSTENIEEKHRTASKIDYYNRKSFSYSIDYQNHDPILITDNNHFISTASTLGWTGDGSSTFPYIIENLRIITPHPNSQFSALIDISHVSLHFQIRNCYLENNNGYTAIYLQHVSNANISSNLISGETGIWTSWSLNNIFMNNTIEASFQGIYLYRENNTEIFNNSVMASNLGAKRSGIELDRSNDSFIRENEVQGWVAAIRSYSSKNNSYRLSNIIGNGVGIFFSRCVNQTIEDNNFKFGDSGISFNFGTNTSTISSNEFFGHEMYGIKISLSFENIVADNTIFHTRDTGLRLYSSDFNHIYNNSIFNNTQNLNLDLSSFNTIENNKIYASISGVWIAGSHWNILHQNDIYDTFYGLDVYLSRFNTISFNQIYLQKYQPGLKFRESNLNLIFRNEIFENQGGIFLSTAGNNSFYQNIITRNNGTGIALWESDGNRFSCNNITFNKLAINGIFASGIYGMDLKYNSEDNFITNNNFVDNQMNQAYDEVLSLAPNIFDQNYWDDWSGSGSYSIVGGANNQDYSPQGSLIDILLNCQPDTIPLPTTTTTSARTSFMVNGFIIFLYLSFAITLTVQLSSFVHRMFLWGYLLVSTAFSAFRTTFSRYPIHPVFLLVVTTDH